MRVRRGLQRRRKAGGMQGRLRRDVAGPAPQRQARRHLRKQARCAGGEDHGGSGDGARAHHAAERAAPRRAVHRVADDGRRQGRQWRRGHRRGRRHAVDAGEGWRGLGRAQPESREGGGGGEAKGGGAQEGTHQAGRGGTT